MTGTCNHKLVAKEGTFLNDLNRHDHLAAPFNAANWRSKVENTDNSGPLQTRTTV